MIEHKDDFYNHLATQLSEKFHEDNGGKRCQAAVRRFLKNSGDTD